MKSSTELKAELVELDRQREALAKEARELEQRLIVVRDRIRYGYNEACLAVKETISAWNTHVEKLKQETAK